MTKADLLKAQKGYAINEKLPYTKLLLYVNRDANDRVNPQGYSIAIAHVSEMEAIFLAQKLLLEKPTEDERVKGLLSSMLREDGKLEHLNVAHMDEATDGEIDRISQGVVAAFVQRTPSDSGPIQ